MMTVLIINRLVNLIRKVWTLIVVYFFKYFFHESSLHNFGTVLQMDQLQVQHHIFVSFFQVALVSVEYDNL